MSSGTLITVGLPDRVAALRDTDVSTLDASDIGEIITDLWDQTLEHHLTMGRLLIEAKRQIGHGGWTDWVITRLPFGDTTARNLMRLATRIDGLPDDLKTATVAVLPREYSVANQVLRLGDDDLGAVLRDGAVKPDMTRNDAQRLVRTTQFSRQAPHPPQTNLGALGVDMAVSLPQLIETGQRYRRICADPAWGFNSWSEKGDDRNPSNHYDIQSMDEAAALPVADVADDDCMLFMWIGDWSPSTAERLMNAWGFEYKTKAFTWVKYWPGGPSGNGTGYYTLSGTETCILGTRGSPAIMQQGEKELIFAPVGPHSAKPEEAQDRMERIACGPGLELNARRLRDGWTCLGNEVPFSEPVTVSDAGNDADPVTADASESSDKAVASVPRATAPDTAQAGASPATPSGPAEDVDDLCDIPQFLRRGTA